MKNQYQAEIDKIRDDTEKLRGDSLARKPGDSVKLKEKKNRTAAELENLVELLKRTNDKQRVEIENLTKENDRLQSLTAKGSNEPALKQKVEQLQRVVQSYENQDVKTGEKDTTIKKLTFANKLLRSDLEQEIERFNELQEKYKKLLMMYRITSTENKGNQEKLFNIATGA